eukprot:scaffold117511_cov59-Attheya_sp.AAC.1
MDEAEQEWKRKECFGTNKTRKESSRLLLELKHRKLPVTAANLWSMEYFKESDILCMGVDRA